MLNRLLSLACAAFCTTFSLLLLLYALFSSSWISTCVPLSSLLLVPDLAPPPSSQYDPQPQENIKLRNLNELPSYSKEHQLSMDRQMKLEKDWLSQQLHSRKVCVSQGFFQYCVSGDGLFQIGDYRLCVGTNVPGREWSQGEKVTVVSIVFSICLCIATNIFLFFIIRGYLVRIYPRISDAYIFLVAAVTFLNGTVILVGLLPVAVQAMLYSFNNTNFYNDMMSRIATIYSMVMKVNWSIKDGDISDVQAWARNIVQHMTDLGLDRDFYVALSAAVLLYVACCCLLLRSKLDPERPPSPARPIHKQS